MRWIMLAGLAGCITVTEGHEVCAVAHPSTLDTGDQVVAVEADTPVTFTFAASSGGCDELTDAGCEVELVGDELVVTTWAETRRGLALGCTDIAFTSWVTCESPPLPAGTYTIVVGTDEAELVVPSESGPICVGP